MTDIWDEIRAIDENSECSNFEYDYDTHRDMRWAFEYYVENYWPRCKKYADPDVDEEEEFDYDECIDSHWREIITEEEDIRFEQEFMKGLSILMKNKEKQLNELKTELDEYKSYLE